MKALYRRYRPKTLAEVVGQEQITDVLANSIKHEKFAHAYLFIGPRGTGKTSVARIFAHEINHFKYEIEDDYLDIIEIDAASNNGVDNIRDLIEKSLIAPSQGKYKIYIIDEVHMLSKQAFNALLKTLEEPPEHVIFIMATTDAYKVPITITSRSQSFTFRLAEPGVMLEHIKKIAKAEKFKIEDTALDIIVRRGGGSFRDTLSLLDQVSKLSDDTITAEMINRSLGLPSDDFVTGLLDAYSRHDFNAIRQILIEIDTSGGKPEVIADSLISRIIEKPEPVFLPLLNRLVDINRQDYPSAQLLLALTYNPQMPATPITSTPPAPAVKAVAAPKPIEKPALKTINKPKPAEEAKPTESPKAITPPEPSEEQKSANEEADTPKNEEPTPETTATSNESNEAPATVGDLWQQICASFAEHAPIAHRYILDSDYELLDDRLIIYAKKKFNKQQLEKKQDLIVSLLPSNYSVEIRAEIKQADEELAAIAELMGGGEEVQINE